MNVQEKLNQLHIKLHELKDPQQKYAYIISQGKKRKPLASDLQVEDNLIKGCISQLWLVPELLPEGKIRFDAYSEALIVNGIVEIILDVVNHQPAKLIEDVTSEKLKEAGLTEALSMNRRSGLSAFISKLHLYSKVAALSAQAGTNSPA